MERGERKKRYRADLGILSPALGTMRSTFEGAVMCGAYMVDPIYSAIGSINRAIHESRPMSIAEIDTRFSVPSVFKVGHRELLVRTTKDTDEGVVRAESIETNTINGLLLVNVAYHLGRVFIYDNGPQGKVATIVKNAAELATAYACSLKSRLALDYGNRRSLDVSFSDLLHETRVGFSGGVDSFTSTRNSREKMSVRAIFVVVPKPTGEAKSKGIDSGVFVHTSHPFDLSSESMSSVSGKSDVRYYPRRMGVYFANNAFLRMVTPRYRMGVGNRIYDSSRSHEPGAIIEVR